MGSDGGGAAGLATSDPRSITFRGRRLSSPNGDSAMGVFLRHLSNTLKKVEPQQLPTIGFEGRSCWLCRGSWKRVCCSRVSGTSAWRPTEDGTAVERPRCPRIDEGPFLLERIPAIGPSRLKHSRNAGSVGGGPGRRLG